MKKLVLVGLFGLICQLSLNAQEGRAAPGDLGNPCPIGMCVVRASFVIDIFNFHKPRTNCTSGFGFCLRMHIQYTCGFPPYCIGSVNTGYRHETKLENGKASGWLNITNRKAELHLPLALESAPGFAGTNFELFHVDADMVYLQNDKGEVTAKLKAGAYPVKRTNQDFTIEVDLE